MKRFYRSIDFNRLLNKLQVLENLDAAVDVGHFFYCAT